VVVLKIKVTNLDLRLVDPKRETPILRHKQAPCALAAAGQLMRFPTRDRPQLIFPLHVLEEGDHAPNLGYNGGLQPACVIMFDKSAQPLMDYVSDLHTSF
jgi:hypothetical protein